eukprot:scaffold36524_cov50-Phaeocystis_antarctica.AAC.2
MDDPLAAPDGAPSGSKVGGKSDAPPRSWHGAAKKPARRWAPPPKGWAPSGPRHFLPWRRIDLRANGDSIPPRWLELPRELASPLARPANGRRNWTVDQVGAMPPWTFGKAVHVGTVSRDAEVGFVSREAGVAAVA